jgi:trehalose synthase
MTGTLNSARRYQRSWTQHTEEPMAAFEEILIPALSFLPYAQFGAKDFQGVSTLAKKLKGRRILHINSTEKGGGVAEMLTSQIGLERGLGMDSRWIVLRPSSQEFFHVTKKMHDLLQGKETGITPQEMRVYLQESQRMADEIDKFLQHHLPDLLMIHDPQPLAMGTWFPRDIRKVLRLHIDLSCPNPDAVATLRPYIEQYDTMIVSRKDYGFPWFKDRMTSVIMPAIDPLVEKNRTMSKQEAQEILMHYNIHPDRPIVSQVSRFDLWKDPIGVIDAYDHAKYALPDLQLLLVGLSQAQDDLTAQEVFDLVKRRAGRDPSIFLFIDPNHLRDVSNDTFVNAVQTASDVVLQKSIREGFGLTVTEALWKRKPVIGGKASGIALQIQDGKSGYLVSNAKETARRIVQVIKDRRRSTRLGCEGHNTVKKKFLIPRYLREHLEVYLQVGNRTDPAVQHNGKPKRARHAVNRRRRLVRG